MEKELVSVIMPAYNAKNYIDETIESILNQSYKNFEILICDDSSRDDTLDHLRRIYGKNDNVKIFKSETNKGPWNARNIAIKKAKGRYLAFLDSDDIWDSEKLTTQLDFMKTKDISFSFTSFHRFSESGKKGHVIRVPSSITYRALLGNTAIATSTVILDRKSIGNIEMRDCYYDDFVLWLSILKTGIKAYGINKDLMSYRVLSNSVSRNKIKSAQYVWATYRDIEGIPRHKALLYFISWAVYAVKKYIRF